MRIVHIRFRTLRGLASREPAGNWVLRLTESGLMAPERSPEEGSPQEDMDQIFQHTMALCDLEDEVERNRYQSQRVYHTTWFSFLILIGIYGLTLLWASQAENDFDRLIRFGWVWIILGIIAIGTIIGLHRTRALRRQTQKAALERANELAVQTREKILEIRDRILARSFVAVVKGRLIVWAPHLSWLDECLRETPPAEAGLREQLAQAREQIHQEIARLSEDPPATWTSEGLYTDLAGLRAAMEAAGIQRIPPVPQSTV